MLFWMSIYNSFLLVRRDFMVFCHECLMVLLWCHATSRNCMWAYNCWKLFEEDYQLINLYGRTNSSCPKAAMASWAALLLGLLVEE